MIGKTIIELLEKSKRTYFSFAQINNYLKIEKTTLKVILSRLVKRREIVRLIRGYYSLPQKQPDLEQLALELVYPSYLSLEYVLAVSGIINQIPSRLTLVTTNRSKVYNVNDTILEFAHIKPSLFFGWKIVEHTLIARPEKSLLDELYLISLKKRTLDLKELDFEKINKKLFFKWLKFYPPSTIKLIKKLWQP
jgi:predicted transcriptional regulator of viral defense system